MVEHTLNEQIDTDITDAATISGMEILSPDMRRYLEIARLGAEDDCLWSAPFIARIRALILESCVHIKEAALRLGSMHERANRRQQQIFDDVHKTRQRENAAEILARALAQREKDIDLIEEALRERESMVEKRELAATSKMAEALHIAAQCTVYSPGSIISTIRTPRADDCPPTPGGMLPTGPPASPAGPVMATVPTNTAIDEDIDMGDTRGPRSSPASLRAVDMPSPSPASTGSVPPAASTNDSEMFGTITSATSGDRTVTSSSASASGGHRTYARSGHRDGPSAIFPGPYGGQAALIIRQRATKG